MLRADTLVTPINDSFVDLDLIGQVDELVEVDAEEGAFGVDGLGGGEGVGLLALDGHDAVARQADLARADRHERLVVDPEVPAVERLAKGDGYLNFVLSSNDIAADSAAMSRRGVPVFGPTVGQLVAAGGRARGWSRIDVEHLDLAQHYPFIIQHDSTGEERRFRLAGWAQPPQHPLGAVQVLSATIAVEDLDEATRRFGHIYGLEASAPFTGHGDGWDALLVSFTLGDGSQHLEFAAPVPLASEEDAEIGMEHLPGAGALRSYLARFGESVCRMTLAISSMDEARRYLDEHGVTYTYQEEPRRALWIHPDYACGASILLHEG